ncbi:MAG: hypothetical protein EOO15_19980 [Chitinophagaceae bacterium]|nr:MAG: hypothetical protein EOO15_19980 [Chitinophagaceae bacterium]
MKKLMIAMLLLVAGRAGAQLQDSALEKYYQLNFITPDMPAYKSLGVEASDLLRPSDVKELALMLNPFYSSGKVGIPKNFGLEFAPWKMASKKWTLSDYNSNAKKRFGYNSSFSLAAASDSTDFPAKLALGYRFALLSKQADLLRAPFMIDFSVADKLQKLRADLETYWFETVMNRPVGPVQVPDYLKAHEAEFYTWLAGFRHKDPTQTTEVQAFVAQFEKLLGKDFDFTRFKTERLAATRDKLVQLMIENYKKKYWNATRFDFAVSFVAESKDTALASVRFSSVNAWATAGLRLGDGAQLLVGGSLKLPNAKIDSTVNAPLRFSVSARLLFGNQHFRFFGEGQWKSQNYGGIENSVLLNLGGEIRLSDRFWVVASSGVENLKERSTNSLYSRLVANLDFRYGLNFR